MPTVVGNGTGVRVSDGGFFHCGRCIIEANSGDGIHADVSASVAITRAILYLRAVYQATLTGNHGTGVRPGDPTSTDFPGTANISGNAQADIAVVGPLKRKIHCGIDSLESMTVTRLSLS